MSTMPQLAFDFPEPGGAMQGLADRDFPAARVNSVEQVKEAR
jgi:hypothetical protein